MDLKEVSELIREDLASGRGTRTSLGGQGVVFGVGNGIPPTIADYAQQATSQSMSFDATTVTPTATKVAKVAEGAPKPTALSFGTAPTPLHKYSGLAEITLERQLSAQGIAAAIYASLASQALMAAEADAYAAVAAAAADTTATSYLGGIAQSQAALLSKGSRPGVVIVPASEYAALVGEVVAGPGFGSDPRSPVGTIFGSLVHVTSATGTEIVVADPEALLSVSHEDSPLVISDPFSLSASNTVRLVLDLVTTLVVSNVAGVAGFTKSAAGTTSSSRSKAA